MVNKTHKIDCDSRAAAIDYFIDYYSRVCWYNANMQGTL